MMLILKTTLLIMNEESLVKATAVALVFGIFYLIKSFFREKDEN